MGGFGAREGQDLICDLKGFNGCRVESGSQGGGQKQGGPRGTGIWAGLPDTTWVPVFQVNGSRSWLGALSGPSPHPRPSQSGGPWPLSGLSRALWVTAPENYTGKLCGLAGDVHTDTHVGFRGSNSTWISDAYGSATGLPPAVPARHRPDKAALFQALCRWLGSAQARWGLQ